MQGAQEHKERGQLPWLLFVLMELTGLVLGAALARFTVTGRQPRQLPVQASTSPYLPREVADAQNRVAVSLNQLLSAISHHRFTEARLYSIEDLKARQDLMGLLKKHGL